MQPNTKVPRTSETSGPAFRDQLICLGAELNFSLESLTNFLMDIAPSLDATDTAKKIFAAAGKDGTGQLSWKEFCMWATKSTEQSIVKAYPGFTEHAYRLLFPYEEKYPHLEPHHRTILPTGVIENDKMLKPVPEKGLIAYTYPQTMAPEDFKDEIKDAPVIWAREDKSLAVVQCWPTSYNVEFKKTFEVSEVNPDPKHFSEQAAEELRRVITHYFGEESKAQPILYCHKRTQNDRNTYVASPNNLMKMLAANPDIVRDLMIVKLGTDNETPNPWAFVTKVVDGKGKESMKPFKMDPSITYVLYVKKGWETMACVKPLDQFNKECDLHDPMTVMELED
eukprot:TRINITY_DN114502_c0_g1_i1.p1 TRINITY_DN114502_c0_g1~~TRINITY_DN114502_c0_g1_i1.p1  ORF type:complete len:338 (-),score=46.65 TRINITY_DN114502_c0_g1_i1:37-1050(-)